MSIKCLEEKIEAVAAKVGVEIKHVLAVLHKDLDKLLCRAEVDSTVAAHIIDKADLPPAPVNVAPTEAPTPGPTPAPTPEPTTTEAPAPDVQT